MKNYEVKINIWAETPEQCMQIGNLLQNTVNVVPQADIIKLLTKVQEKPSIVKTALKWI
ncbi:MAG: hypothetical protein LBS50_10960 [Prevotellaceae bacterium]|jgi:hypothetical protein|nr:hypothetical protein [Prevotellaceae bacterium]